jgi:saccharopine dehydrogenase (NAD+, L-lysine forming)
MKIGIITEGKTPPDKRVPFTPKQLAELQANFEGQLSFEVESSAVRCFQDEEYIAAGVSVVSDVSSCDLLMGIKEVPVHQLIATKEYIFFSHTIKKQANNRKLLQAVLDKGISLMDYEILVDDHGVRTVAFGKWAGIVGAYNALWTYGKKTGLYDMKRAYECFDKRELAEQLKNVQLPPIKLVVTGAGKVGKGVIEILEEIGLPRVSPHDFLHNYYDEAVYTVLSTADYNRRKIDGAFDRNEFYSSPEKYESHFLKYSEVSDIFIAAAYWDRRAPRLFDLAAIQSEDFNISVIADITCDVDGSIPTTLHPTSVLDPVFDVDRDTLSEIPAFGKQNSISVMAIDNLPTELPRDASEDFGNQLIVHFIPELLKPKSKVLDKASITKAGDLTIEYIYLQDFVEGKE